MFRSVLMQDNEKDYDLTEDLTTDNEQETAPNQEDIQDTSAQPSTDDTALTDDGKEWEFDAAAPTLDDSAFLENENFVIDKEDFEKSLSNNSEESVKDESQSEQKKDDITISRDSLKLIPTVIITALVLAVVIALGVRYYTVPNGKEGKLINPPAIAATIDGSKISVGMYNYYYASVVSYYEQYAAYGYFDLDTSKSYDKKFTVDENGDQITWKEFFDNEVIREIKLNYVYYNKGKEQGVTLTKEQKDTIEEQIESMKASASESKVSLNEYISSNFGEYCTEDTVRLILEQYYIASNYKGRFSVEYKPEQKDIDKYFEDNKSDYNQISFSYLAMPYDTTDDKTKAQSQKTIDSYMSKITDRNSILALVPEVYDEYIKADMESLMASDPNLSEKEAKEKSIANYVANVDTSITGATSPFDEEFTDWIFSDNTKIGDKNYYIDEENGYAYIVLKTEKPSLNESQTYTVRHILIMPESDAQTGSSQQTEYTDEQWAAAEQKANKILDEFNNGDRSEYSFALLAETNSADTASLSAGNKGYFGGICEAVPLGEMVSEFEDWSIDSARQYGDVGIVKSTYGYHIMFFVDKAPSYEAQIKIDMRTKELDKMMDECDVNIHKIVVNKAVNKYNEAKKAASTVTDGETQPLS